MRRQLLGRAVAPCTAALLLAGCAFPYSPAPVVTNFRTIHQEKVLAAAHWKAISAHIEQQLSPALRNAPRLPLYVQPVQATPFNQALASQMITSLVNDGFVVSKMPEGALLVEIDTQAVEFSRNRPQYKTTGEHSALAAGLWVLTDIQSHTPQWFATAAIFTQDAYKWFQSQFATGETPKTEILISVGVSSEQRYYARSTSVYYTSDSDRTLYQVEPPKVQLVKSFAVKGEGRQ
ncbi:hypothetical protein [Massilia horti]|uniref:Lipoprotein n=1 Tax=Massilia horti TaxID=2562153 RepID=A0A4Y9T5W1_9BURK|nr:hypothetical protein [Massilia horti]TFW36147.1 hypothetical protein E4O92_00130 [Massilia horti]